MPLAGSESPHGQTTVVQALSLGKPVVATRTAWIVDYVTDGEDGLLVDAGDAAGMRDALLRLRADDALRRRLVEGARSRATEFSYAAHADRLAAVCAQLL